MNWFEERLLSSRPTKIETIHSINVKHVDASIMDSNSSFGHIVGGEVYVRDDLSNKVKKFVIAHEIYHLNDEKKWLGWVGREARANVVCGVRDPHGFVSTVFASLNKKRIAAYLRSLIKVNVK